MHYKHTVRHFADVIPEVNQCSSHFRDISAAIVTSSRAVPLQYQDAPCYLKFSADGAAVTRKRLMLKFTRLKITDCRVKLKIYDGRSQLSLLLVSTPRFYLIFHQIISFLSFKKL